MISCIFAIGIPAGSIRSIHLTCNVHYTTIRQLIDRNCVNYTRVLIYIYVDYTSNNNALNTKPN